MADIFLAPVKFSNTALLKIIRHDIQRVFNKADISIINLDVDPEPAKSNERGQYYSTKILADSIDKTEPYDGNVVLITDFDLYIPIFTFLFGEAQLNGKHSIVSTARLHEEVYTGRSDNNLLIERTMKEILHELGHNFGLIHCRDWNCVMHTSTSIEEVDIRGGFYCKNCLKNPAFKLLIS